MQFTHVEGSSAIAATLDGKPLIAQQVYQEAFGLQTIADSPFYFFKRDSKISCWYEDRETMLG
jgi:hypothetical protein